MKVEDLRPRGASWSTRHHEKGGKHHTMSCHHAVCFSLPEGNKPACSLKDDAGIIDNTAEMLRVLATTLEGADEVRSTSAGQPLAGHPRV